MSKKGTIKRAVGYARVSTDMQNESSIDAQIYGIKEYCEKHGYCLVNNYIDFGISGTTDQRPQFQQMIEDGYKFYAKEIVNATYHDTGDVTEYYKTVFSFMMADEEIGEKLRNRTRLVLSELENS